MESELEDNLTIIESFVTYCKSNNVDKNFVSKLANQIKLHYSEISDDNDLYGQEMKYDFSDIEFIDNDSSNSTDDESQNEPENEDGNEECNNNSDNESKEDSKDDSEDETESFNKSTIMRLKNFLIVDYDPKNVYLYNKKPKVVKSIEDFVNQSDLFY